MNRIRTRRALPCGVVILPLLSASLAGAQPSDDSRLDWWREARFGMFIHWGPVSLKGTEIGWSRGAQVPTEEYDNLYRQFNPIEFDAAEWVAAAKAAGMKYLVITSKHHDGFCLWDSRFTDYDIMSTPFQRDVLAELAEECRRRGIRFCTYYSICDWHHPDYPTDSPGGRGLKPAPDMSRYVQYVRNQTRELIEGYGPLGLIWFDGQWEKPWTIEHGEELYSYLLDRQPDLIINNRVGKARPEAAGTSAQDSANPGDYDTPEQRIGAFNRDRPWETCMTLCRQWAWKPNDEMKSLKKCIHALIRTAGGDGNFLFNVGPMPDGRIEPRQVQRLEEMGRWLKEYGHTIYGTRGGPFKPGWWGASTCRDDRIFLFIMTRPDNGVLKLPAIDANIVSIRTLSDNEAIITKTGTGTYVRIPQTHEEHIATIVEFTVDCRAFDIPPVDVPRPPSGSLAFGKPASASNTFRNQTQFGPDKAIDDDPETRWATDEGTKEAWIEVDLGKNANISRVKIDEAVEYGRRIRRFVLQYKDGDRWQTALRGTTIGDEYEMTFPSVLARRVKLLIMEADEGPTIWEFQLFGEDD
ncbi:MAG: alpha-L-fucosidase [Phycisphaerales bacterium]|nr:MAG: alpha-L-fucosidase [Phycisphaerales bacterium]